MTTYLVFASQSDADSANAAIGANMGCPIIGIDPATGLPDPAAQQTTQWAVPQQTDPAAGTYPSSWVFPVPDPSAMAGVAADTLADYDPSWFPTTAI